MVFSKAKVPGMLALLGFTRALAGEPDPVRIGADGPLPVENQHHAAAYNATFQSTTAEGFDWSGGDHALSFELPRCLKCPTTEQKRRLWFFGDTLCSYEYNGKRYLDSAARNRGYKIILGNSIGLTYHTDRAAPSRTKTRFDWVGAGSAWLPILLDTAALADMHPARIARHGYQHLGFTQSRQEPYHVWWDNQDLNDPGAKRDDLSPVYEYHNPVADGSILINIYQPEYFHAFLGYKYQRIAFYVLNAPAAGTVPLYFYHTNGNDPDNPSHESILSTENDLNRKAFNRKTEPPIRLGYVYPETEVPAAEKRNTTPLWRYRRSAPAERYIYTTRPNRDGWPGTEHNGMLANWPLSGIVLGTDLVLSSMPTHINVRGIGRGENPFHNPHIPIAFEPTESNLFSIIPNVHMPMTKWGKHAAGTESGGWHTPPTQSAEIGWSDIRWGVGFVKEEDYVYIFGTRHANDVPTLPVGMRNLYLARIESQKAADLIDPDAWQFWNGAGWTGKGAAYEYGAAPLHIRRFENGSAIRQGVSRASVAVTVARGDNGAWYMPMSRHSFPSPELMIARADALTGPWTVTAIANLWDALPIEKARYAPDPNDGVQVSYYGYFAHQGLSLDHGGLLISSSRAGTCWLYLGEEKQPAHCDRQSMDERIYESDIYLPSFIDIPWSELK